ncbi:MAG: hypothetical protein HYT94_03270 [Parcubacteria group bacterium]|nr:hypothetical protein [Parcubacteria group bacterium]
MNTKPQKMPWKEKITAYIKENKQATVKELAEFLPISLSLTHRYLKALLLDKVIQKVGSAPRVFYVLADEAKASSAALAKNAVISESDQEIIEKNFLLITPQGERVSGSAGFMSWCSNRGFDMPKKAKEYVAVFQKYENFRKDGFIDGTAKLKESFTHSFVDKLYYIDFYAWEIFGKTKLGQLLLYAKQSQDARMIAEISEITRPYIARLVKKYGVDAIGYIPPTVKREVQFMNVLEKNIRSNLPVVGIEKAVTGIRVPQKTLNKLADRIENARGTFFVTDRRKFGTVLLIDDAIGSGATLNEITDKIKKQGVAKKVIGLAITGSAKGFDVISEV